MSSRCSVFGLRAAWRPILVLVLVVAAGLALTGMLGPLQSGALILLPALALALAMLTRPYLGERALARLRSGREQRPRATALRVWPRSRRARAVRGGRLIAVALAGRAPPLALANRP